jgi:hypothetical protein
MNLLAIPHMLKKNNKIKIIIIDDINAFNMSEENQ